MRRSWRRMRMSRRNCSFFSLINFISIHSIIYNYYLQLQYLINYYIDFGKCRTLILSFNIICNINILNIAIFNNNYIICSNSITHIFLHIHIKYFIKKKISTNFICTKIGIFYSISLNNIHSNT